MALLLGLQTKDVALVAETLVKLGFLDELKQRLEATCSSGSSSEVEAAALKVVLPALESAFETAGGLQSGNFNFTKFIFGTLKI